MTESTLKEQLALLSPIVYKLINITGAARNAFNRHSRESLAHLKNLQEAVAQEISMAFQGTDKLVARRSGEERAGFLRLHSILTHLNIIAGTFAGLADPLDKKIKGGVLFSDKAVSQTNFLFDQLTGLLRSLVDIILTENEFLKKYAVEESQKLTRACMSFATEHEDRLIEGLCTPQAAPIFLAVLDRVQIIGQHQTDIAKLLAKQE